MLEEKSNLENEIWTMKKNEKKLQENYDKMISV